MIYLPLIANGRAESLTVATFNIGYNYDPDAWAMAAGERVGRIAAQLAERGAEIVALQEVMHRGDRAEAQGFAASFPGWGVYTEPHNETNHYSNMLLSQYPIVEGSQRTHTITSRAGRNDRVNVSVQVRTPLGIVRVWCIHTRFEEPDEGTRQIMRGVSLVNDWEGIPFIVAGDFNTSRRNVLDIADDVGLQLAATTVGRIDHILAHGLAIVDQLTIARPNVPGEHDPVFATVSL